MRRINAVAIVAVTAATLPITVAHSATAAIAPVKYKNCTQLNLAYPHGVGLPGAKDKVKTPRDIPVRNFTVNTAIYNANKTLLDRDKDHIACEKH